MSGYVVIDGINDAVDSYHGTLESAMTRCVEMGPEYVAYERVSPPEGDE